MKPTFMQQRLKRGSWLCASILSMALIAGCSDQAAAPEEASGASGRAPGKTEIVFWHSMEGGLGKEVDALVQGFNQSQDAYVVKPVYKGNYSESMNAGIAAYRAGQSPDILQVFEVGTATMMYAGDVIKPVQALSEEVGNPIDAKAFVGAVGGYYSDQQGKLVSMPFNSSTAVMYYNKDILKKAGLSVDQPPKTYAELFKAMNQVVASGAATCGYTSAWPAWLWLENFAAWHNIPYASENNGFGGLKARISLEHPLYKRLLSDLKTAAGNGAFTYGGRGDGGKALFVSGKCAAFTSSSASRAEIAADGQFDFGIAPLPYYDDVAGAPQNSIIGGASLWVFNKKSPDIYKGVVQFFHYLAQPEMAAKWHQQTGYVPVVTAAYEQTRASGFYDQTPGADVAVKQLDVTTTNQSKGIRLGSLAEIRDVEEGDFEKVFNGSMTVEAALADMQKRSNDILARFESTVTK